MFPRSDWLDPCSHLFSSLQEFLLVWKQMPKSSFARFSSFARGRIVGRAEEGAGTQKIRKTVLKQDGRRGSLRAIEAVVAKARAEPKWQGENSSAGGLTS